MRRLCAGVKLRPYLAIIRLTIALVMDPKMARPYLARVAFILNAFKDAQLSDAIAELQ